MAVQRYIKPLPPLLAWVLTSSLAFAGGSQPAAFGLDADAAVAVPEVAAQARSVSQIEAENSTAWTEAAWASKPVAPKTRLQAPASTLDEAVDTEALTAKPIPLSRLLHSAALSVGALADSQAKAQDEALAADAADISAPATPLTEVTEGASGPASEAIAVHLPAAETKAAANEAVQLTISAGPQGLVFAPESLLIKGTGKKIRIQVVGEAADGLQLFMRDQKVVELQANGGQMISRKQGSTELYAVAGGRMYIVPVGVQGSTKKSFDLQVPAPLLSLSGIVQGPLAAAQYPGIERAAAAPTALPASSDAGSVASQSSNLAAGPSLNDSVAETAQAMLRQAREAERFTNSKDKIGYKSVHIQLIDDRSDAEGGKIYPVVGATVRILGTAFTAQTDATGHLTIRDMPQQARFMLRIDDPNNQVRSSIVELVTGKGDGVQRLRVMRNFTFDAYTSIAQTVQQATLGSYCASVTDTSDGKTYAAQGVAVQLDVPAEGPFYFNNYGFLDRSLNATGPNGRFCYFNVTPGPAALTVFQDEAPVATLPISIFYNRHVEDDISLAADADLTTQLASAATAQEQLGSDPRTPSSYKQVDMIDLLPLGTQNPLAQVAPGSVASPAPLLAYHGRQRAYAQAAEFEPVVYTYTAGAAKNVTPLIPRGFIEDMSLYAQVVHDPQMGSVLAEYSAPEGADHETIAMRLVDQEGRDVGDGWYYSDAPLTKAIFFNVPAGSYSLQVQTKDGYWLSSDTVIVYNETTSYARMGNQLQYRP